MRTESVQLSLLRRPAFALSARGRFGRSVRDSYATLLDFVLLLRCQGRVAGVGRRLPYSHARGWTNRECLRLLGIDRRELPKLERCGLIRFDGLDLVLTRYRESTQWREEERLDQLRRIGRVGGVKSGESRRKRSIATLGSLPLPHQEAAHIRASVLNVIKELASSAGSSALDSLSNLGAHRSGSTARSGWASEGSPDPEALRKTAPSGVPSDLKRMAPASAATVQQLVLRGTRKRVARTGGSVPSARASNIADPAVRESGRQTGPEAPSPRGIEFCDLYRRVSGNHHRPQLALQVLADFKHSPAEHQQCLRFVRQFYARPPKKPGWRPAAAADFLTWEWRPVLERLRRLKDGGPATAAELVAAVLKKRGGAYEKESAKKSDDPGRGIH